MMELFLGGAHRVVSGDTGPGSQALLFGTRDKGYYGTLTQSEFIDNTTLASLIGLTEGVAYNSDVPWLKFASNNKTLFIPQKAIRRTLAWSSIYNCGAVYGDDTNGYTNPGTPVLQNRKVTIGGKVYRVRLITGSSALPANSTSSGGEWNKLFYPLVNGEWTTMTTASATAYFGVSSTSDLGSCTLCQETMGFAAVPTDTQVIRRGFTDYTTYGSSIMSTTGNRGWRPVLELVN
ncbi:putative virion structural protein [Erwinia phage Rebecca]|uniref:Putative virion structural protein n=1 Tax=Erwinia phage Rebecca TaxID=2530026 RepID=A0A482IER2_9CAUD|nr:putative virion structural protein [Erwinia phage Rebecca]